MFDLYSWEVGGRYRLEEDRRREARARVLGRRQPGRPGQQRMGTPARLARAACDAPSGGAAPPASPRLERERGFSWWWGYRLGAMVPPPHRGTPAAPPRCAPGIDTAARP